MRRAPVAVSGLFFALLLLAALIFLPRLERAGRERLAVACAELQGRVAADTGFRLSFASLSPAILRGVSLDALEARDGRGRLVLSARRAYLYYDIWALLSGGKRRLVSELRLEGVKIDLDSEDLSLLSSLSRRLSGGRKSHLPDFAISGSDLSLELEDAVPGGLLVALDSFRLSGGGSEAEADLKGRLRFHRAGALGPLEIACGASGAIARNFSAGRLALSVGAEAADFSLATQRFDFSFDSGGAELRKVADKAPLDAELRYVASSGLVSARVDLEAFRPRQSFRARKGLASIEPWLSLPYTGKLSLSTPLADLSRLRYEVELEAGLSSSSLKGMRSAAIKASGDAQGAEIGYARLVAEIGEAEYSGSLRFRDLAPNGLLKLSSSEASPLPLETSLRLFGNAGRYAAVADSVALGGVEIRDFVVDAALRGDAVDFSLSLLLPESEEAGAPLPLAPMARVGEAGFSAEAAPAGGLPRLRIEGSLSGGAAPMLDLSLALDSADLKPLEPLLARLAPSGLSTLLSGLRVDGEVYFRSDFSRFSYSSTNFLVVSRSASATYALLSFSGNEKGLTLKRAELSGGGRSASLNGSLDFSNPERLDFAASLVYADTPYDFRGSLVGPDLFVSGDYGLKASLRQREGEYFFNLNADALPLPLGELRVILSLESSGYYLSPGDFRLDFGSLRAEFGASSGLPSLSCVGLFGPKGGSLSSLLVQDSVSKLRGGANFSYDLKAARPALSFKASLSGEGGESYGLSGSYGPLEAEGGYGLDAKLLLAGSPLARFTKGPISGRLSGSAEARGGLSDLGIQFAAKLNDGLLGGEPFALQASGSERGGRFELSDCSAFYQGMSVERLGLSFDAATAAASLRGDFRTQGASLRGGAPGGGQRSGAASAPVLSFSFAATGKSLAAASPEEEGAQPKGQVGLAALFSRYRVEGSAIDFKYRDTRSQAWPFSFSIGPEGLSFLGGPSGELSFDYQNDGSFKAVAASPLPFNFRASGRAAKGEIKAEAADLSLDLPFLVGFASGLPVLVDRGRLTGALSVQGSLSDPDFSGSLELSDLVCRVPSWLKESLGPLSCPILIDGKRLSSSIPSLQAGDARLSLEIQALMDGWLPGDIDARFRTLSGSALNLDSQVLGIFLKGRAGADLDFKLSGGTVGLSGKLMVERSDVVINPGLFASSKGSGEAAATPFDLDLSIGFGPGVRVYFPSKDIPIVMGYADPSSSLRVLLDGETGDLSFKGTAQLRGGDVFYIQRDFYLKTAKIVFNETNDKFDPLVTLEAERHERKDQSPVLISLKAESQPISAFAPKLSADDPSLTQAEIVNILGSGLLGVSEGGTVDWKAAAIAGSEFVPQLNVTKTFENKVREVFGLDVFFLQSQVVQRWLIDISETSSAASSNSLASYLDGTSLFLGKYLGDSVFVHASAGLEKDPLARMGLLRLDSELGVDFETPFGRLVWSISPESPENLFISDQSLSLSWKLQL